MEPRHNRTAEADRVLGREGTSKRGQTTTALETLPGSESTACLETEGCRDSGSPWRSHRVVSSGSKAGMPNDRDASMGDGVARSVRRAAHVPCWWKSSQTALQAGSEAKGGGTTPRRAWLRVLGREGRDRTVTIYGDGEMSAEQETLGMCARRLRTVVSSSRTKLSRISARQDRVPTVR